MSYVQNRTNLFSTKPKRIIICRDESRLKKYDSATDPRSWLANERLQLSEERREFILEVIRADKFGRYIPVDVLMNTLLKSNKDGGDSSTMRQHLNELHEFVDRLDLSSGQRSTLEALKSRFNFQIDTTSKNSPRSSIETAKPTLEFKPEDNGNENLTLFFQDKSQLITNKTHLNRRSISVTSHSKDRTITSSNTSGERCSPITLLDSKDIEIQRLRNLLKELQEHCRDSAAVCNKKVEQIELKLRSVKKLNSALELRLVREEVRIIRDHASRLEEIQKLDNPGNFITPIPDSKETITTKSVGSTSKNRVQILFRNQRLEAKLLNRFIVLPSKSNPPKRKSKYVCNSTQKKNALFRLKLDSSQSGLLTQQVNREKNALIQQIRDCESCIMQQGREIKRLVSQVEQMRVVSSKSDCQEFVNKISFLEQSLQTQHNKIHFLKQEVCKERMRSESLRKLLEIERRKNTELVKRLETQKANTTSMGCDGDSSDTVCVENDASQHFINVIEVERDRVRRLQGQLSRQCSYVKLLKAKLSSSSGTESYVSAWYNPDNRACANVPE